MNTKMKVTCFLGLVFCLAQSLSAQQGVVASGGDHSSSNGSVAYSVGQIAFATIDDETGNLNPGLQQPFQFTIVGINDIGTDHLLNLYPNPANQFLFLQLSTREGIIHAQDFIAKVYDAKGNLLITQQLDNPVNSILISDLPSGQYFVQIWQSKTLSQSISFSKIH